MEFSIVGGSTRPVPTSLLNDVVVGILALVCPGCRTGGPRTPLISLSVVKLKIVGPSRSAGALSVLGIVCRRWDLPGFLKSIRIINCFTNTKIDIQE